MVSLVDIGPATGEATIFRGDKEIKIPVNGLTAEDIAHLFMRFPELRKLVTGNADADVIGIIATSFPHLLGELVAAVTGNMGNDAEVEAARKLGVGEQWAILERAMSITFPQGAKNFLDGLFVLAEQAGAGRGWAPGTISPAPSSAASKPAGPKETAGEALPVSSPPGANSSQETKQPETTN